jgi:hypothetical protein
MIDSLVASRAVVRADSHEVLGVVGSGFTPLQNAQALAWFDPWLASGLVTLETAGSLRGGRIVWALARASSLRASARLIRTVSERDAFIWNRPPTPTR